MMENTVSACVKKDSFDSHHHHSNLVADRFPQGVVVTFLTARSVGPN
jgi:hypothetical protein